MQIGRLCLSFGLLALSVSQTVAIAEDDPFKDLEIFYQNLAAEVFRQRRG
jgi:hypothetical protein